MNVSPESTNYIQRSEYEARHSELRTELLRLSTEHDSHFKWVVAENDKMRTDVQTKFDVLSAKLDAAKLSPWKLIAVSLINFLLGCGLIATLNYFHLPR